MKSIVFNKTFFLDITNHLIFRINVYRVSLLYNLVLHLNRSSNSVMCLLTSSCHNDRKYFNRVYKTYICVWRCTNIKHFMITKLRCVINVSNARLGEGVVLNIWLLVFVITNKLNLHTIVYMNLQFPFRNGTDLRGSCVWNISNFDMMRIQLF